MMGPQVVKVLDSSLQLDDETVTRRLARDFSRINNSPLLTWSEHLLLDLLHTRDSKDAGDLTEMEVIPAHHAVSRRFTVGDKVESDLRPLDFGKVRAAFAESQRRVLFLDYSGTLFPREGAGLSFKHQFLGTGSKLSKRRRQVLRALAEDPNTTVMVVMGTSLPTTGGIVDIDAVAVAVQVRFCAMV